MESNLPELSKTVCNMVRALFFMLRKGFSKAKLVTELNLMLKRPRKLAGRVITNLISHRYHCHHGASAAPHDVHLQFSTAREYEFSCSNTPKHGLLFSKRHIPRHLFACAHAPLTLDSDVAVVNNALKVALQILDDKNCKEVVQASPAHPQLRVTDSPLPVQDDGDHQVDKAAEEFIQRFFKELRKQG